MKKNKRNLVNNLLETTRAILFVIAIIVLYQFFSFLYEINGSLISQKTIEMLSAGISAILGAAFTYILLSKQTKTERDVERDRRSVSDQIQIFTETIESIRSEFEGRFLDLDRKKQKDVDDFQNFRNRIKVLKPRFQLAASEETAKEFESLVKEINYDEWQNDENLWIEHFIDKLERLARKSRNQVGLYEEVLEDIPARDEVTDEKLTSTNGGVMITLASGSEELKKYVKFSFGKEEKLPIGKLVLNIVKEIAEDNNKWETLKDFMDQVEKKKGGHSAWDTKEYAEKIYKDTNYRRHYLNEEDIIREEYAVSSQWNREGCKHFLDLLEKQYRDIWKKVSLV